MTDANLDSREGFDNDDYEAHMARVCELALEEEWENDEEDADWQGEDDDQPDESQEWDDLYGYGPEFDSFDGYDEY